MEQKFYYLHNVDSSVNMFKNKVDTYHRREDYTYMYNVGLSISQWLPCPLAIWAFALNSNLAKKNSIKDYYSKAHGIGGGKIDWIEKWLTDRRLLIVVDGEVSSWRSVLGLGFINIYLYIYIYIYIYNS